MSDQSDSQNRSEEHQNLSEGTSPSRSSDDGSKSMPSNLPKDATRHRKKRTSESENEDYIADEEVTSKKKLIKNQQVDPVVGIKPGMKKKAHAQRKPMSKVRASTQETMEFSLEPRKE